MKKGGGAVSFFGRDDVIVAAGVTLLPAILLVEMVDSFDVLSLSALERSAENRFSTEQV